LSVAFIEKLKRSDNLHTVFFNKDDAMCKDRRNLLSGGIANCIASNFITGIFMTGLFLKIMASEPESVRNDYIGIQSTVSQLAALIFPLISPLLFERLRQVKKTALTFLGLHYFFCIFGLGVLPFIDIPTLTKAKMYIGCVFVMQACSSMYGPPTTIWHIACIPQNIRPGYFSVSQIISPLTSCLIALLASFILDNLQNTIGYFPAIAVLRFIGLAFAILHIYLYAHVTEYPRETTRRKVNILTVLSTPFKYPRYFMSCMIAFLWAIANGLPGSYFTAYMLENMGVSYSLLSAASFIAMPFLMFFTPVWSKYVKRRKSWLTVMALGLLTYSTAWVLQAFVVPGRMWLYFISLMAYQSFAPAINLANANLPYMNIPEENQTTAYSFYAVFANCGGLLGVYIGKTFISLTNGISVNILGTLMQNRQLLLLLTFGYKLLISVLVLIIAGVNKRHNVEY